MTRKRRYLICAAVLVACVCIALGVLAMLPPRHGGTKAKFDFIEIGMTEAELNTIFGGPGSSINTIPSSVSWAGNDGTVSVYLDANGRAENMQWFPFEETFPDKLRRWLHLPDAAAAPVPGGIPPAPNFP